MKKETNEYSIVLVFYLDRELLSQPQIAGPFVDMVNRELNAKNPKAVGFFLPTDGEERIECINPVQVSKAEMSKINKLVDDIKKQFDVNQEATKEKSNK